MEYITLLIAVLALALSGFSFYRQFYHKKHSLKLAVGWLPKQFYDDGRRVRGMSLVLTNCGTVPVIITKFEVRYRTKGTKSSGTYLKPKHEVVFDVPRQRIPSGDHLVAQLFLSDEFPGGEVEMSESQGTKGPDGKPFMVYSYPVNLSLEYLDDDGQLKYANLELGEHSFSAQRKHEGFSIPAKPQEIYQKG